jgi:hypothetical protein
VIKNLDSSTWQPIDREIEAIYEHIRQCASNKPPESVINQFKCLFLECKHENSQISKALEKIIFSPLGQQKFDLMLTNCCYLIIDCWSNQPESLKLIDELINIFNSVNQAKSYDRRKKQLIQLIGDYQKIELYLQLRAIVSIITVEESAKSIPTKTISTGSISTNSTSTNIIINTYIRRYTYLYEYFLSGTEHIPQLTKLIKTTQATRRENFEIQLSKHIIYRVRLQQVARIGLLSKGAGKIITRVENPTLLSEKAFKVAMRQYIGKIDGEYTLLQLAQRFLVQNNLRNCYQEYKRDLHQYLINNIERQNNNYQFESKLRQKLNQIFPQSDSKSLNQNLILQTCRQLFSFMIVEVFPNSQPNYQQFSELISNLGTAQTVAILIKLILICPEAKSDLEKKMALITTYYQLHSIKQVPWLVKTLEHLLIAFSIYLGKVDVSIAKII